jgi:3-oxoacyl-[acyl-carrier-protein] synthase II
MGIISPLGNSTDALWAALTSGRSGVGPLSGIPAGSLPIAFGAEAREFQGEIGDFGPLEKEQTKAIRKGLRVMCRECQMGVAAAQRALADARMPLGSYDPERVGVSFGSDYMISLPDEFTEGILQCLDETGQFDFSRWATDGMPKMFPLWLLKYLPNMPASHLAIYNDLRGPSNSLTLREAVGNVAVVEAFQIIAQGRADVMVVGATGTRLHPMKIVHALQQEEIAVGDQDPTTISRPFDKNRTGMVLGEGSGALVLEELGRAQARGATIYGEVLGGASSSVAGPNLVAQRDQAMKNALTATLASTDTTPEEVGFINAHGLSTQSADREEAWAIREVFGEREQPIPVVAAKSYFGNLGAGSGMVELAAGILALSHDRLFPVLNFQTPDSECPVAPVRGDCVKPGGSMIKLSVTPQGQASAAMVARFTG